MGDDQESGVPERWLEVTGGPDEAKTVYCPRRDRDMTLHDCFGCKRYATMTIDPAGKHVYVDCAWDGPGDPPPVLDGVPLRTGID